MSWDLIKLAFECEGNLEGREDHILLYLAYKVNQNEGNVAWCTQDYLSRKSKVSISTVKRALKSLREKGIISWTKRKRDKGKFDRNHYTINTSSLRAMVKEKEVSKRTKHIAQNDIQVGVTMSDNKITNNLTYKIYKPTEKSLTSRQLLLVENLAEQYHKTYKNNYYGWTQINKALVKFLKSNQTEEDWCNIGIGLPSPMEKGWLKKNLNNFN